MGRTILFQGFLYSLSDNVAWACAAILLLVAIYLAAREIIAIGWLGEIISDAALGICQWLVLLSVSTLAVMLLAVFLAASAVEAYWAYYYPWSVFMT
jgi:hypothetical protein